MKTTLIAVHRAKDNYKQRILGENWEESYRGNERANQGLPRFCLAGVVVICLSFCISVCLFLYLSLITFVRCVYFWIFAISSVFISFLTCQNIFLFSLSIPPPPPSQNWSDWSEKTVRTRTWKNAKGDSKKPKKSTRCLWKNTPSSERTSTGKWANLRSGFKVRTPSYVLTRSWNIIAQFTWGNGVNCKLKRPVWLGRLTVTFAATSLTIQSWRRLIWIDCGSLWNDTHPCGKVDTKPSGR